ncbi:hypothetical protein SCANM124S_01092 [Streptomyces canus]
MTSRSCGWQRTVLVAPGGQSEGKVGRHGHHSLGMLLCTQAFANRGMRPFSTTTLTAARPLSYSIRSAGEPLSHTAVIAA